jgi:hypothetical protein
VVDAAEGGGRGRRRGAMEAVTVARRNGDRDGGAAAVRGMEGDAEGSALGMRSRWGHDRDVSCWLERVASRV